MTEQRKLAAVMFTDIVGYTSLMSRDEKEALALLQKNRGLQKSLAKKHHGEFLKEMGDGTLLCFQSALDAVHCAMEIQTSVKDDLDLNLRIGIHLGDIVFKEGDVFGDGVNVASRIEGLADEGGICISEAVNMLIRNHPEIRTVFLGEKQLKNVDQPIKIYSITDANSVRITEKPVSEPSKKHVSLKIAGAAIFVLVLFFVLYRIVFEKADQTIDSIAVLPLENLSTDPDQEYFADGMTDALIAELAQISALRVISRTSVMQYKSTQKPMPEIARELDVDALVEGTVLQSGDQVRITVQLLKGRPERHLWAGNYVRNLRDIIALQEEVARSIADTIQITLTQEEKSRLTSARPVDPEAYQLYLKGRYFWNERTATDYSKSFNYFTQAIKKDPTYALAYVGIADYFIILGFYAILPPNEAFPRAKAAAEKALEIDETLAEGHTSLAYIKMLYDWDWTGAEREFKKAIRLNPNYAVAHQWYGEFLSDMGRHEEAITQGKQAQSLDPFSSIVKVQLASSLLNAGQIETAIEAYHEVLEFEPDFQLAHFFLSYAYLSQGKHEEAIIEAQHVMELSNENVPGLLIPLGCAYAKAEKTAEAREILNKLIVLSGQVYVTPFGIATIYSALGEKDCAFEWLEKAFKIRDNWLLTLMVQPSVDDLRSDPRFLSLSERMGFKSP